MYWIRAYAGLVMATSLESSLRGTRTKGVAVTVIEPNSIGCGKGSEMASMGESAARTATDRQANIAMRCNGSNLEFIMESHLRALLSLGYAPVGPRTSKFRCSKHKLLSWRVTFFIAL